MAAIETRPDVLGAEDEEYLRGQAGQVGSGALGGWMQSGYGGCVDHEPPPIIDEVRAELRRLRALAAARPATPALAEHPSGVGLAA
jgi:hypothetical protein